MIYKEPEIEIIEFGTEDVITDSTIDNKPGGTDIGWF